MTDIIYKCYPCKVEGENGMLTVHGDPSGTVWCPWCGDPMEKHD